MNGLNYDLNGMVAITQEEHLELLGYKDAYQDLTKRGMLETLEFTTMQQERKIVENIKEKIKLLEYARTSSDSPIASAILETLEDCIHKKTSGDESK